MGVLCGKESAGKHSARSSWHFPQPSTLSNAFFCGLPSWLAVNLTPFCWGLQFASSLEDFFVSTFGSPFFHHFIAVVAHKGRWFWFAGLKYQARGAANTSEHNGVGRTQGSGFVCGEPLGVSLKWMNAFKDDALLHEGLTSANSKHMFFRNRGHQQY